VISLLSCSLQGQTIEVELRPGSRLSGLHAGTTTTEQTTCNYGLNPDLQDLAQQQGMIIAGTDDTGEVRAIERPDHPFFMATLYQPQLSSTPSRPHPVFVGLLQAMAAA
jgi:CTP synthase (UTP-ammonia lyase)